MAFQVSPGVLVQETDLTSIVPTIATSPAAIAIVSKWGPIEDPITVTSENVLVERFGAPSNDQTCYTSFLTASSFLAYANNLLVTRIDGTDYKNACSGGFINAAPTITAGGSDYTSAPTITFGDSDTAGGNRATGTAVLSAGTGATIGATASGGSYTSATIGAAGSGYKAGDKLKVLGTALGGSSPTNDMTVTVTTVNGSGGVTAVTLAGTSTGSGTHSAAATTYISHAVASITLIKRGTGYTSAPAITFDNTGSGGTGAAATCAVTALTAPKIKNITDYQTNFEGGEGDDGIFIAKFPGALGGSLKVAMADSATFTGWTYEDQFDGAPGTSDYASARDGSNDELHIIVIDEDGQWTGTQDTILEKFAFLSKAADAKKSDGTSNYYKSVINSSSKYIWWGDHPTGMSDWGNDARDEAFTSLDVKYDLSLVGGVNDMAPTSGNIRTAYDLYANDELFDVALILTGMMVDEDVDYVIQNVAEVRKDCVVFCSPLDPDDDSIIKGAGSDAADACVAFRDELTSSSYAFLDSGFKYMYDRYNDTYRYVPLNGDMAGLCARTDVTADPWFSPGGFTRGQVKNVVKLAFNPGKTERDTLYKKGINPVVTFPGQGTVLFGDKTLLAKPSAFDRINVRRLFIILEKSIATAAKFQLFEFNDAFTRAQFKNIVEPFLRDVQGRRGVTDFRVKCDDTNNTGEVIDRNEFVASIFIKPARSINFITLNFVAARSSVSFEEIGA